MLFKAPKYRPGRIVLSDERVKAILNSHVIRLFDRGLRVAGRVIGYQRHGDGTLVGIVANPVTGNRHLVAVDYRTGLPRHLRKLA